MRKHFVAAAGDLRVLTQQANQIVQSMDHELPENAELLSISHQHGVDVATLVLEQCLRNSRRHGGFIQQLEQSPDSALPLKQPPTLLVVPGLYYKEKPYLGADAALITDIAGQFGINVQCVPTRSLGGIEENAEILHKYLQEVQWQSYWVVSVSRGSAELKWLLHKYSGAQYLEQLQGWVSVNGIVQGSRLFDRAGRNKIANLWFKSIAIATGIDPALVDELQHTRKQWSVTALPDHTTYVNLISFPMSWDITTPVVPRYERLCRFGPNDGAVMLLDYLAEPGLCVPVGGVDHLLRRSDLSKLFYRLFNCLLGN